MKKIILIPALVGVLGIGALIGSTSLLSGDAQENKVLSTQEIEQKALAIVNGTVTNIELDKELTSSVYEVEIKTATEEHDLKLDAYTGELLSQRKEALEYDDIVDINGTQVENNTSVKITKEQAIEKALTKAKGTVKKIELDYRIYEIEIVDGLYEYNVDIDATTGEIIGFEQDIED